MNVAEVHPDPVISVETRPSVYTGFSFWVVLTYKEHSFEELLSATFPGLSEEEQDREVLHAATRLGDQLRPILEAEDA